MRPIDNTGQITEKEISVIKRELSTVLLKKIEGDVVELGCFFGTTSIHISRILMNYPEREFYVYDSFEGLPEKVKEDDSALGVQFKAGELLTTKKQFIKNLTQAKVKIPKIKKAWFDDLTENDLPFEIAFAFLDGDFYESIKTSFKLIEKSLVSGSIVIVHDYNNAALPGAKKATDEWLAKNKHSVRFEQSLAIIQI